MIVFTKLYEVICSQYRDIMQTQFGSTLERLISYNDITRTIHLFMFHLSEKQTNVCAGISWIALDVLNSENFSATGATGTDFNTDKLASFLVKYSVGILDFFKLKLLDNTLSIHEQEKTISSLEAFIKLIKTKLKPVHIMCFSILK